MEPRPDTTTRVVAHGPTDVLAYLPYRFGFVPTRSLAVLAVTEVAPGRRQLGLAVRLDLDDLRDPEVMGATLSGITAQLDADGAAWAFTALYSEESFESSQRGLGAHGAILRRWVRAFPFSDDTSTLLAGPERFRCLECADDPCCPTGGHPNSMLSSSAVAAEMVLAGHGLVGSRDELGCPRDPTDIRAAEAAAAAERELLRMSRCRGGRRTPWRARVLDDVERALAHPPDAAEPLPAAVLGRLAAALGDGEVRDAVLAWALRGTRPLVGSDEVITTLEDALHGRVGLPPPDHVQAVSRLLTEIGRHAPQRQAGRPLAVLAWLAWWCGEGARADVLRRQSLDDDPCCRLAHLLGDVLLHGVPPGWARPPRRLRAVPDL